MIKSDLFVVPERSFQNRVELGPDPVVSASKTDGELLPSSQSKIGPRGEIFAVGGEGFVAMEMLLEAVQPFEEVTVTK